MTLKIEYVLQGLTAAREANLQFDNFRDFEHQITQIEQSTDMENELANLKRQKSRAIRLYKQYLDMGGMFFGLGVVGADDDPILNGEKLPVIE